MKPKNFDDIQFSSVHRRIMLWGSGGPFLDGYVLVLIGVALEQLTPVLSLSSEWIGTIFSTWALPLFITKYGVSSVVLMGTGVSLIGLIVSILFAPETKDLTLAQTSVMGIRRGKK